MTTKNLLDLLSEEGPEYLSSKLKMRMNEIQEAKNRGFTNKQIVKALNKIGLHINESTFRSYISRYSESHGENKIYAKDDISENKNPKATELNTKTNPKNNQISNSPQDIANIASIKNNLENFSNIAKGKI